MRHRAWGLLVLVPAALFAMVVVTAPFELFHFDLSTAGSPGRFAAVVVRAGRSDARGSLWIDNVFVLSWLLIVPALLRAGVRRWAPERRREFGIWVHMPLVALAAGEADIAENVLSLFLAGKTSPPAALTLTVAVIAWAKWALYLVALVGVAGLVIGPLLAPVVRPVMLRLGGLLDRRAGSHPAPVARAADGGTPGAAPSSDGGRSIGICVSGGGIRAASVAIGALGRLDEGRADGPSLFARSRWLVAVSGGAYAAAGWRVSRRPGGAVGPLPSAARDGLFDAGHPWAATVRARRRFLDNGRLSLVGGMAGLLTRTIIVVGAIMSAVYLVGFVAGHAVGSTALHPDFPFVAGSATDVLGLRDLVPLRLVLPGAALLVVAGMLVLASFSTNDSGRRAKLMPVAVAGASAGVVLLVLLVGVPAGVVYGRTVLGELVFARGKVNTGEADGGAGILGALSAIGLIGALTGVIVGQLKRRWMRLGGVLLAAVLVLLAGKVADTFAWDYEGVWRSWPLPFGDARLAVWPVALAWLLLTDSVASHRLTLGGVYRKRLAATFTLANGDTAPLLPLDYAGEPLWPAYAQASGPELIVAATAHTSADTFCGLPAYGFTFRSSAVTMHDRVDTTSASVPTSQYPTGSWWEGYPRGWLVTRSMALSGAAFASAMGRQALGTTNALLVALNLRLGSWVPNPRFAHWFADRSSAPRVHLGYLAKELFGRYRPDRDAFVYVADGGHRENLGLVELLRERPDVVFCVDASGDRPDSFQTLHEAIELAIVELGIDIDIDLTRLQRGRGMPLDSVVVGTIRYPDAAPGTWPAELVYGKSQLSETAVAALLQYGAIDDRFPDYSTIDQFLTEAEHIRLVALGHHLGERMAALFDVPAQDAPPPAA